MFKNITAINLYRNEIRNWGGKTANGMRSWRAKFLYTFVNWSSAVFTSEYMGGGGCQVVLPLKRDYLNLFNKTLEVDFFLLEIMGEKEGENHTVFFIDSVTFEEKEGIQTLTIKGSDFLNIYNKMGIYRFDAEINYSLLGFTIDNLKTKNLTAVKDFPSTNLFLLALQSPVQAYKDTDSFHELTDTDFTSIYPEEMGLILQEENTLISKGSISASKTTPYILSPYAKAMTLLKDLRKAYNYGIYGTALSPQRESASSTKIYYRVAMKVRNATKRNDITLSTISGTFQNPSRTIDLSVKGIGGLPVVRGQDAPKDTAGENSGEKYLGTGQWVFLKSLTNLTFSIGKDIKLKNVDNTVNFSLTGVKPPLVDSSSTHEINTGTRAKDIRNTFTMLRRICERTLICDDDILEGTIMNVDNLNLGDVVTLNAFGSSQEVIITGFTYYSDASSFTTEVNYEIYKER